MTTALLPLVLGVAHLLRLGCVHIPAAPSSTRMHVQRHAAMGTASAHTRARRMRPGARMLARSEQVYACPHRAGESLLPLVGAERAPAARPAWQDVLAARAAEAEALAGEEAAAEAAAAATAGQDVTAAAASALLAAGVDLGAVTARPRASRARLGYLYPISTLSMTRPRAGRTRQDAAAGGRSGSQYHLGRMRTPLRMRKPNQCTPAVAVACAFFPARG